MADQLGDDRLMFTTANVTLMVTDFDRSLRFYTETLGLGLQSRHGDHWAEVIAPGVTIGLHPSMGAVVPASTDSVSVGFMVEDFDATVGELRSRGVEFDRVTDTERARSAYFADPDGHPLYVMWRAG